MRLRKKNLSNFAPMIHPVKTHHFIKALFLFFCFITLAFAGNIDDLLQKADHARKAYKDMDAIGYYQQILQMDSNNLQALWNTSFVYQRLGWLEQDKEVKRRLYENALLYANKVYKKYPGTYEANIVMAGGTARMSEFLSAKERVHAAWDIKKHGDAAFSIHPDNPEVWYLLGWLNFELSKATWVERSVASLLFGGLPGGMSFEKGILYLRKANELKPDCIVYLYDLATFYERTEDTATAIGLVKKALSITAVAPEDFLYQKKCENLLTRLDS